MNITDAQYVLNEINPSENKNIKATIDGQVWHVPLVSSNAHYAAIIEWSKEDGNEIQAAD